MKKRFLKLKNYTFLGIHILLAIVVTVATGIFVKGQPVEIPRIEFVLNSIITCASTLIGFILTSLSIIFGLVNTALLKAIYSTQGRYELNVRYMETTIIGTALIIACIITGAKTPESTVVPFKWFAGTFFLAALFVISFATTCYYLMRIILYAPVTDNDTNKPSTPEGDFRI